MRHVDEGQLHAWLDRDRSELSAGEAAVIERHLEVCAECRVRLDDAQRVASRAAAILAGAGPAEIRQPDFQILTGGRTRVAPPAWRRGVVAAAWAASFLGAVGLGWWTRELLRPEQLAFEESSAESQRLVGQSVSAPASPSPQISASAPAGGDRAVETVGTSGERRGDASGNAEVVSPTGDRAPEEPPRLAALEAQAENRGQPARGTADASGAAPAVETLARGREMELAGVPPANFADAPTAASPPPPGVGTASSPADVGATSGATPPPVSSAARAANTATSSTVIRGRVTDENGAPLGAVQVTAPGRRVGSLSGPGTLTDPDGNFELDLREAVTPPTEVTLAFQRIGFVADTLRVRSERTEVRYAIRLRAMTLALQSVVATGAVNSAVEPEKPMSLAGTPAPPGAPNVTAARADAGGLPDQEWREVGRAEAARLLGITPVLVPGLSVIGTAVAEQSGQPVIRIMQRLEDGTMFTLFQRVASDSEPQEAALPGTMTVRRGDLIVTVMGAVSTDRLTEVLDRVR